MNTQTVPLPYNHVSLAKGGVVSARYVIQNHSVQLATSLKPKVVSDQQTSSGLMPIVSNQFEYIFPGAETEQNHRYYQRVVAL